MKISQKLVYGVLVFNKHLNEYYLFFISDWRTGLHVSSCKKGREHQKGKKKEGKTSIMRCMFSKNDIVYPIIKDIL